MDMLRHNYLRKNLRFYSFLSPFFWDGLDSLADIIAQWREFYFCSCRHHCFSPLLSLRRNKEGATVLLHHLLPTMLLSDPGLISRHLPSIYNASEHLASIAHHEGDMIDASFSIVMQRKMLPVGGFA